MPAAPRRKAPPSAASASWLAATGRQTAAARGDRDDLVGERLDHDRPVELDRLQRVGDLVPRHVARPGRAAVVLAGVEVGQPAAGGADRVADRLLLEVHVERVEQDAEARAVDPVDDLDRLVGDVHEARLEPVQRLEAQPYARVGGVRRERRRAPRRGAPGRARARRRSAARRGRRSRRAGRTASASRAPRRRRWRRGCSARRCRAAPASGWIRSRSGGNTSVEEAARPSASSAARAPPPVVAVERLERQLEQVEPHRPRLGGQRGDVGVAERRRPDPGVDADQHVSARRPSI